MTPMVRFTTLSTLCAVLAGCATYPSGPTITALPGGSANFDQFRVDDYDCQGYARQVIGPPPGQAASESGKIPAQHTTAMARAWRAPVHIREAAVCTGFSTFDELRRRGFHIHLPP